MSRSFSLLSSPELGSKNRPFTSTFPTQVLERLGEPPLEIRKRGAGNAKGVFATQVLKVLLSSWNCDTKHPVLLEYLNKTSSELHHKQTVHHDFKSYKYKSAD